jgi:penicillin-binding protein 1A
MIERIKRFLKEKITTPLSILLAPVTTRVAHALEPVGRTLQPYKERFDAQWAGFAVDHPKLAVWLRRGTKLGAALYAFYFIFAIGLFGEIPTVEELRDMQTLNTSQVYTSDSLLIGKFYKENRKDIQFENMPKHVVDALVANEDERYFEHSGVDYRALGRVLFRSILGGDESSGGGSTISQQLAKNLFGRKHYRMFSTPINKVREMLTARRLEEAYDKKNLMTFYLNTVPFGSNVFGIEMASKRFFNKTTSELKVEEGAVIVGMLTANTRHNPKRNPDLAFKRRNVVMSQMVKNKFLTQKSYDSLKVLPIKLEYQPVLNRDAMASYFKDYLRTAMPKILENVKKDDGSAYDIYKDGLKIYTSIDSKMQLMAEASVQEHMSKLQRTFDNHWSGDKWWGDDKWLEDAMRSSERWKRMTADGMSEAKIRNYFMTVKLPMTLFVWDNGKPSEDERTITPLDSIKYYFRQLNTGFMVMDPKSGFVKAWVGGTDFNFYQYDHVKSKRQVGSTFKPIVYAKAIQAGVKPCEYISNALTAYMPDGTLNPGGDFNEKEAKEQEIWIPHNSDGGYSGSYSLQGALTNSVNVVSARLIHRIGYRNVQDLAKNMGVTSEMQNDMSIALGTADISLFDMIKVYGTFANRGRRPEPTMVLKVATRDGKVIADFAPQIDTSKWQQVLTTDQADIMTKMMKGVINDGTGSRIRSNFDITGDLAGKTGTTQNHSDGWFMCYTPNLVCGAWVGGITPAVRFRDIQYGQGAYMALPICGTFLKKLYATPQYSAMQKEKFPTPAKWVIDSMECPEREFSDGERAEMNSENNSEVDSTLIINESIPMLPTERPNTSTPTQPIDDKNKPDGKGVNADGTLPSVKPEVKPMLTPISKNPPMKPNIPKGNNEE